MFNSNKQPKSINFLDPVAMPTDRWANAYLWLSNIGKNALIVVEVIVLIAFFSRFFLDKQNNDLAEEINSQVSLLENNSWKQSSIRYDNFQKLLSDIGKIKKGQTLNSKKISEIISAIPGSLGVKSFSFSGSRVSITIETTDFSALKSYEESLKSNEYYSDVRFNISKENSTLNVNISFVLKSV